MGVGKKLSTETSALPDDGKKRIGEIEMFFGRRRKKRDLVERERTISSSLRRNQQRRIEHGDEGSALALEQAE